MHQGLTTRKWSIPDAEKDVGITDVGKKDIPDAVETALGEASEKTFFSTHTAGVGHETSGKGPINFKKHIIPDVVHSASGTASGIGVFPTHFEASGKPFNEHRE